MMEYLSKLEIDDD